MNYNFVIECSNFYILIFLYTYRQKIVSSASCHKKSLAFFIPLIQSKTLYNYHILDEYNQISKSKINLKS